MKVYMCFTIIFLLASIMISIHCEGGGCNCPSNQQCCTWKPPGSLSTINSCYSTSAYTCPNDPARPGQKCLCGKPFGSCCNFACYNEATMDCVSNHGNNGPTCLCKEGYHCCNGDCYDPAIYHCVAADNKVGKRCLCQNLHDKCWYDYYTGQQTCYNSGQPCRIEAVITTDPSPPKTCGEPVTIRCQSNYVGASYIITGPGGLSIPGSTYEATISGEYRCTATFGSCTDTASVTINTNYQCPCNIEVTITTDPASGNTCNETITITCGSNEPEATFTITGPGGLVVSGSTYEASESGEYTCTATFEGCTNSTSVTIDTEFECPSTVMCPNNLVPTNAIPEPSIQCIASQGCVASPFDCCEGCVAKRFAESEGYPATDAGCQDKPCDAYNAEFSAGCFAANASEPIQCSYFGVVGGTCPPLTTSGFGITYCLDALRT